MYTAKIAILSSALILATGASAQSLTRADVRAQLVQAEQSGSQLVTNASYPEIGIIYQNQVARPVAADMNAYGAVANGSHAERPTGNMGTKIGASQCVGPYSFCNLYAGS